MQSGSWFRMKYCLGEVAGRLYLTPASSEVEWYQPLSLPPPAKQPKRQQEWQEWPHTALARVRSPGDALEFACRWGLLGVAWVEKGFGVPPKQPFFMPRRKGLYRYREPVDGFARVAGEFRRCVALLRGERPEGKRLPKTPQDCKTAGADILNSYLRDCRPFVVYCGEPSGWETTWQAPSLLHYCYLLVWLDLTGGRQWHICEHRPCGEFFLRSRPTQRFCSEQCERNFRRLKSYYDKRLKKVD